ncbi:hypothetical protein F7661_12740 [Pseudomonas sp. CFA]|nr:hypothetical protein F7661_12740 [Pseudomonas sp. CFA]
MAGGVSVHLFACTGLFAGEPAPTTVWRAPDRCGSGLARECDGAATVNDLGYWLAGPALSRVNPLLRRYVATLQSDVGAACPRRGPYRRRRSGVDCATSALKRMLPC